MSGGFLRGNTGPVPITDDLPPFRLTHAQAATILGVQDQQGVAPRKPHLPITGSGVPRIAA